MCQTPWKIRGIRPIVVDMNPPVGDQHSADQLRNDVDAIYEILGDINGTVDTLDTIVDTLSTTVDTLDTKVDTLSTTVDSHSATLNEHSRILDEHTLKLDQIIDLLHAK